MLLFAPLGAAGAAPKARRPADLRETVRVETARRNAEHAAWRGQWRADVRWPPLAELASLWAARPSRVCVVVPRADHADGIFDLAACAPRVPEASERGQE